MLRFHYHMETFIEWLEAEIKARDWKPADLAHKAAITDATLSRILSGSRQAGIEVCQAIAHALGVSKEKVYRRRGFLDPLAPEEEIEEDLLFVFRQLSEHDQQAALRIVLSLANHPTPEPVEVQMVRELPQLQALREAITLWRQGKELEAFWPLAQMLSPEMQAKVEAFLIEIGEVESQEKLKIEGGD